MRLQCLLAQAMAAWARSGFHSLDKPFWAVLGTVENTSEALSTRHALLLYKLVHLVLWCSHPHFSMHMYSNLLSKTVLTQESGWGTRKKCCPTCPTCPLRHPQQTIEDTLACRAINRWGRQVWTCRPEVVVLIKLNTDVSSGLNTASENSTSKQKLRLSHYTAIHVG